MHLSRNSGHSFRKSISRTHKRVSIIIFLPCRTTNIASACSGTARQLPRRLLASLSLSLSFVLPVILARALSLACSPAQCEICLRSLSYRRRYRLSLRRGHDGDCGQEPPTRKEQQQQQKKAHTERGNPQLWPRRRRPNPKTIPLHPSCLIIPLLFLSKMASGNIEIIQFY